MKLFTPLVVSSFVLLFSLVAEAENNPSGFMYKFSNGDSYTNLGTLLGESASVGVIDKNTKSSCHFRSGNGASDIDFGVSEGVQFYVVPLEETSDGVRTLVSITRTKIANEQAVAVAVGTDACSLTTGDFSGHTTRTVQTFPIGKPVSLKMKDGTTYTITTTKLADRIDRSEQE